MESDSVFQIETIFVSRFPHPVALSKLDIPAQLSIADLFSLPIHQLAFSPPFFGLSRGVGWVDSDRETG
jgi:hypothetical protein